MKKPDYVAIVGRPNVGKSSLFNRLTKRQAAIVDDQPGVTRDRHYGLVRSGQRPFVLIDTAGFVPGSVQGLEASLKAQVEMALDEAEVIVFLLDGRQGLTPADEEIAGLLRRRGRPVVVAVNKIDSPELASLAVEFHLLGLGEPLPISAAHGLGLEGLTEAVEAALGPEAGGEPEGEVAEPEMIRLAIVGRPNVGKSSLVNRILGQERMVVSAEPGTTRDAVDVQVEVGGKPYLLIDTAGIRRPGRIKPGVEKWSVLRAFKAIDQAEVATVLADALEGLTDQEARICGLAWEQGRPVILALNKWDLVAEPVQRLKALRSEIERQLKFLAKAPVLTISAKTGLNLEQIFKAADRLHEQYSFRAGTAQVNQVLEEALKKHQPPLIKGRRLKFYYATQAQTRPPTFVVFTNRPDQVHFSYQRFLANQFKAAFGLEEIPVRLYFRPRSGQAD